MDTEIAKNTIAEQLANQLDTESGNIKFRRFVKKPDVKLTTAKVGFSEKLTMERALENGVFINHRFFRPTDHKESTGIYVTRSFKGQKFKQIASSCKMLPKCSNCAENHSTYTCEQPERNYKCQNCQANQFSASKECPAFLKTTEKLYKSRIIPITKQLRNKIDKKVRKTNGKQIV